MIRLLPFVIMSVCALLVLKGLNFALFDAQSLLGTQAVVAQEKPADGELEKNQEKPAVEEIAASEEDEEPVQGRLINPNAAKNGTRETIAERLGERRIALDKRERDVSLREKLLKAAELRLDEKLAELKAFQSENGNKGGSDAQTEVDAGLKKIVSMYENMKPKQAARIFDVLDMEILYRVANSMAPRKMSAVLAEMDLKTAGVLTIRMASNMQRKNKSSMRTQLPKIGG